MSLQTKLSTILDGVLSHSDKNGRLLAAAFEFVPSATEYRLAKYPLYRTLVHTPIALANMRERVDANAYASIVQFTRDFAQIVTNAQLFNKKVEYRLMIGLEGITKGSEVFRDSITLHSIFAQLTEEHTGTVVDVEVIGSMLAGSLTVGDDSFKVGDCVYIDPNPRAEGEDRPPTPRAQMIIACIYSILQDKHNLEQFTITAQHYIHPHQTFHKQGMRFSAREVLKTNTSHTYSKSQIVGRCYVLFHKDYVRGVPHQKSARVSMADVYCCENRYNEAAKTITKIKLWNTCLPESCKGIEAQLDLYPQQLVVNKTALPGEEAYEVPIASILSAKRKRDFDFSGQMLSISGADDEGNPLRKRMGMGSRAEQLMGDYPGLSPSIPMHAASPIGMYSRNSIARKVLFGLSKPIVVPAGRPLFFLPKPIMGPERLQDDLIDALDVYGDKTVRWFSAPPLDLIDVSIKPVHSKVYLDWKLKNKSKKSEEKSKALLKKVQATFEIVAVQALPKIDSEKVLRDSKDALIETANALAAALHHDSLNIAQSL